MRHSWALIAGLVSLAALVGVWRFSTGTARTGQDTGPGPPRVEKALSQSPEWVDFHLPELSDGGYNLALYNRRIPFLMDMNGAVVHTWPDVRAAGRATLLPTGHLDVLTDRGHLEEYDWEGRKTWSFESAQSSQMLHHDFARLRNGDFLLLVHQPSKRSDSLLEVDRSGEVVWTWDSREAIREDFRRTSRPNRTHMNSVQELPPNRWFDQGHEAFRPGNILVSARNLNALYIVERPSGDVVWRYYEGLDWQHEARMVPAGLPGAGNILFFNNRYHSVERQSAIVELDPLERSVVWTYRSPGFFSATEGIQQALSNGNLLVTSSHGGRVFEVTREKRIVWQWVPPYPPVRVSRYPYDFCAQLASLEPPAERPIRRHDPERFIDADQYSFALHDVRHVPSGGSSVVVLREANQCRQVHLPDGAEMTVGFGVDQRGRCEGTTSGPARFGVSIRPSDAEAAEQLLERTIGPETFDSQEPGGVFSLRRETFPLARHGRQTVEICLTLAGASGGPPPPCYVWEDPEIRTPARSATDPFEEEKSAEVLEHERQQLEALGYVN
ncbi:MAG: arylsulfotransferase family protein [Acidobacteriota bacterium]|jgi:hypothetical protein